MSTTQGGGDTSPSGIHHDMGTPGMGPQTDPPKSNVATSDVTRPARPQNAQGYDTDDIPMSQGGGQAG